MNLSSDGYWPSGMDQAAQNRSLSEFGRLIYPIWRGIEERDAADDLKKDIADHAAVGQILYECATLHKQDLAVIRSNIKPNRMITTPIRTAASNKYGAWKNNP